ncbi:penicillin-binding protein [Treponema sp.]|uniref:penicillin-binding protein n=1 Tax=Treponema sp. TaxID=166 RepID=UPI00298DEEB0|nr:penicillin-binding protein [Treponema sp.]
MNSNFKKAGFILTLSGLGLLTALVSWKFTVLAFGPQKKFTPSAATVERGSIVDRNGKPLAVQTNFYHFVVTPKLIKSPEEFANNVAPIIGCSINDIQGKIEANRKSSFIYLKKKISQDQYDELVKVVSQNGYSNFTRFDKIPGRIYPENNLASQLIGYMGDDGIGLSGIEYSQQAVLSPEPNVTSSGTIHGDNVYLTIDAGLQYKLQKIALDALNSTQAESIMLIASDATNGEILSYISLPSANLNEYGSASTSEKTDRPSITAYEPGSVFKIFSVASFLNAESITPDDSFLCDGIYKRKTNLGETIKITCLEHHGWLNARTALKYSCNDALSQMSEKISTEDFLSYIRLFGFGERTGVELPSETRGSVKNQSDKYWSARSKPTMSIGQEISVSALQMVQAASVLANKGVLIKPTFIQRITDIDGNVKYQHEPTYGNRVLRSSTAEYLLSCMETTAQSGTGTKASLRDIAIGVKTGTAQMADPVHGGYSHTDFLSNCMAIFPVNNPQIILYIVIQKAKGETYAGRIVAPVIADAADEIIDHLGINRENAASLEHSGKFSLNEIKPLKISKLVPDFKGRSKRDLLPLLDRTDIKIMIDGEGWVVDQNPEPGTPVTENMTIELFLE